MEFQGKGGSHLTKWICEDHHLDASPLQLNALWGCSGMREPMGSSSNQAFTPGQIQVSVSYLRTAAFELSLDSFPHERLHKGLSQYGRAESTLVR